MFYVGPSFPPVVMTSPVVSAPTIISYPPFPANNPQAQSMPLKQYSDMKYIC